MDPRGSYDELCRLCASYDAVKMDLFGQEGKNRQLIDKIQACLPFKIAEDDRLPKCLCYRCMYNLENFYDFRTACVNAVALLESFLSSDNNANDYDRRNPSEHYSELRSELLKEKEHMPILIPEAPVVNPNAALGTPPRLNSDGEADNDIEEVLEQSGTDEAADDAEDRKSEEYEMDMETNPSDFLEMPPMVTEEAEENETVNSVSARGRARDSRGFQHKSEQHEVYVCSLCNKAFSSKGHLSLHARIHVGAGDVIGEKVITDDHTSYKRPFQCDLCYKAYSTAKHRWGHVSTTHRGHPAVTCRYCSRIYSTRVNLEEHIKSKHTGLPLPMEVPVSYVQPENKYQCKTCPKMYTNTTDLNKHSRICTGSQQKELPKHDTATEKIKKTQLDTSDMSSNDSNNETKDYKNAEAKLAKNPQLTILKQALTKGDILKRSYDEKYKTSSKTKKQARTDTSETDVQKRWFCESCPQNFSSLESFKEHELSHEAENPYFCLLCEKDFAHKSSLSNHIVTMHGVDPNPIVESDRCLKKSLLAHQWNKNPESANGNPNQAIKKEETSSPFPEKTLENEEEYHEGNQDKMIEIETVFVCEICTRDFNDRASLWLHIRATHKECAAFACGVCLKICSDNAQLLNHVNMYHGGSKLQMSEQRRYSCTICGRQHDSRKKLITHVSIHNVDPSYDPSSFVQLNSNYYNENLNSNEANEQVMDGDVEDGEKVDCYICYKSFPNEDHLIRHQRNAHKSDPAVAIGESTANGSGTGPNGNGNRAQYHLFFVCELCGSSHPSKWERWLHVSSVHGNEPAIKCEREDCAKIFATKSLRNEHAQHHLIQGSSPNTCEICGKLWGSRVDYWKHVMGVHSDTVPLICGVCLKVFPNVLQLSSHVKVNHWPLTNGDFSCDICGRPYSNKSKMSRHRKIHGLDGEGHAHPDPSEYINDSVRLDNGGTVDVDYSCEMCGDLKFLNLEDLCNHRRMTHSLFPCDLCNKCYGRTSHLWKHVNRVHKGHEDVTCRFCMKTSASRDHLAAHIAKIHRYEPEVKSDTRESTNFKVAVPEDEILHHCEKCNKGFHKRYLLRRHMKGCQNYRKDPGALLTRCRACERIFKDRASLQKHIENHHSSYTCHLCNETITSKLGIMTHNRVNHMDHPDLTCEHSSCKKLFRTKEDLESHKKDHKYHTSPNVCDFCGDTVENKLKLKMHVLSLHRNEIGVSCGVCLIPMKDPKDLKKHVEDTHESILSKPNTCQVCGKQYASKWKAFDHTKKCHGKVFKTCKQCLAVFITEESMKNHYEHVHNVPKDQLATFEYRLEIGRKRHYDSLEIVMKEEPEELEFDEEPIEDYSNDYKRRISDSDDYDVRPDFYIRENNEQEEPMRPLKKMKLDSKTKKMTKQWETFECENCKIQFNTKIMFWNHINVCPKRNMITKEDDTSFPTSILEAHLKNNNLIKREEPEQELDENNLNIPDFNLFEDINMQLSGQKPVQNLSLKSSSLSNKCSRKDSRKVYDESTNTECTCEVCGKQWPAKKHLWQHLIRFHRAEAAVTCGVCLKLCTTYEDLADHLKAAHEALLSCEGNNFTCKVCGRYHNARSKLLLHMSIHINCKNNPMCKKCNRSFETEAKLKEHIGNCEGRQSGLGIRHDAEEDVKNDNDIDENDEKGSFIGDEGDDGDEKEGDYESEGDKGSDNDDSSSDDSEDSETDSSSSSSDDEDNENAEENELAAESRTTSRLGELSCTSDSEEEGSENSVDLEDTDEIKTHVGVEDGKEELRSKEVEMKNMRTESNPVLTESDTKDSAAFRGLKKKLVKMEVENMDYSDDEGPPVLSPMMPLLPPQEGEMNSQMDEISHKLSPMVTLETKLDKEMEDCEFEDVKMKFQDLENKNKIKRENLEGSEESESESEDENKMCIYEEAGNRETKQEGVSTISDEEEDAEMQEEAKDGETVKDKRIEVVSVESEDESENEEEEEEEEEEDGESEDESEQVQIANHNSPATIDHSETLSQDFEGENSDQEEDEEDEEEEEEEDEDAEAEEAEEDLTIENAEVEEEIAENHSIVEEEVAVEESYEDEPIVDDEMNNEDHSIQNLNKTILTVGKDSEGNPILIREVVTQYAYPDEFDCESDYAHLPQERNSLFNAHEDQRISEENFALNNDSLDQTTTEPEVQTVDELGHHEEVETDEQVEDKANSDIQESTTSAKS